MVEFMVDNEEGEGVVVLFDKGVHVAISVAAKRCDCFLSRCTL